MEQILDTHTEGRAPAASEPVQPRTEGTREYVGECAAGVTEDEMIIEARRIERIGTCFVCFSTLLNVI